MYRQYSDTEKVCKESLLWLGLNKRAKKSTTCGRDCVCWLSDGSRRVMKPSQGYQLVESRRRDSHALAFAVSRHQTASRRLLEPAGWCSLSLANQVRTSQRARAHTHRHTQRRNAPGQVREKISLANHMAAPSLAFVVGSRALDIVRAQWNKSGRPFARSRAKQVGGGPSLCNGAHPPSSTLVRSI